MNPLADDIDRGTPASKADATVTLTIATEEAPAETETLLYDYPGTTDEWVVLSAHVDGHDLAESAMDNGTGLASVLAVHDVAGGTAPARVRQAINAARKKIEPLREEIHAHA